MTRREHIERVILFGVPIWLPGITVALLAWSA
jgi:hypothetical protein